MGHSKSNLKWEIYRNIGPHQEMIKLFPNLILRLMKLDPNLIFCCQNKTIFKSLI